MDDVNMQLSNIRYFRPEWTPDVCRAHGGHCYVVDNYGGGEVPPILHRRCKHCGWVQEAKRPEKLGWYDDEHQPFAAGTTQAERDVAGEQMGRAVDKPMLGRQALKDPEARAAIIATAGSHGIPAEDVEAEISRQQDAE